MSDNRKDEGTDKKKRIESTNTTNVIYEVPITRKQGKLHQMNPKVYRLKESCTSSDGVRKEGSVRSTTQFWFTCKLNSGGFTAE